MRAIVLLVAKAPVAGSAKTRLCPPADPAQAAEIAAAALLDTLDAVGATPTATPVLALSGDLTRAARGRLISRALRGWTVLDQRGGSFADRLAGAHADVAGYFPGRPVLQIGMDTPQLGWPLLDRTLRRLTEESAALLGPAVDGGWWGLGLRDPADAEVLRVVPTSRSDTAARTRAALLDRGLHVEALPELRDVDTLADAVAVAALVPGSRFAAAVAALPDSPSAFDGIAANLEPAGGTGVGAARTIGVRPGQPELQPRVR